jgi:hypothetical protein
LNNLLELDVIFKLEGLEIASDAHILQTPPACGVSTK